MYIKLQNVHQSMLRGGATKMAFISSLYPQYNYDAPQYKMMAGQISDYNATNAPK